MYEQICKDQTSYHRENHSLQGSHAERKGFTGEDESLC